jgi:hypothetical protein
MGNPLTTWHRHQLKVGDVIEWRLVAGNRWQKLRGLLSRPRVRYVSEVKSSTVVVIEERRMTWAEWRGAVWRALSQ